MNISVEHAAGQVWDVIVIGAGMGGGMAGRRLADAGLSVLFVEKGPIGYRTEEQYLGDDVSDPVARHAWGAWPYPAEIEIDGKTARHFIPIGCGVGGSSVYYAAILERPEPHDLDLQPNRPHPTDGWPVSYAALAPYYDLAEDLLEICGDQDPLGKACGLPLRPPPPLSKAEIGLMQDLRARGLHPYRLHSALRYLPGCKGCTGHKCPRTCKMDGRSAGVEPALATGNASMLADCTASEFIEDEAGKVTSLAVRYGRGRGYHLQAKVYVLAAGALGSPRLLLASTGRHQTGCANSSGLVGRNLMFHLSEFFAVWPRRASALDGPVKVVALRDFYYRNGQRLGLVQSLGVEVSYGDIVHYLNKIFDRSFIRRYRTLRHLNRVPALLATYLMRKGKIFVGLLEDFPYSDNRVFINMDDPDVMYIDYRIRPELRARRSLFRKIVRREIGWSKVLFLGLEPDLNFGHPSGTLRFGRDPKTSVLDPNCKAHDLDNLYVVDASFMPTSMGVNPSLTIAANALRVADIISKRLKEGAGHV